MERAKLESRLFRADPGRETIGSWGLVGSGGCGALRVGRARGPAVR